MRTKKGCKVKIGSLFLCFTLLMTTVLSSIGASAAEGFDYSTALKYAITFYDANKCGPDAEVGNEFSWRKACHTEDGKDVGLDLTGGYHDAGDFVKFGLPQGYAAAVLGWSLYEFRDVFDATGNTEKQLTQLKYFTDYFLKSHPKSDIFYYQVGDGELDHQYWGAPHLQTGSRPAKCVADASHAASDVLGEHSAALSLMYLNYKDKDAAYASKCLQAAKELYAMGKAKQGVGDGQYFYRATSFGDDLAWAAVWLYVVEKDAQYLEDAKKFVMIRNESGNDPLKSRWTMCWDDMYLPVLLKLADLTGEAAYKGAVEYNLDYWMNTLDKTPGGLRVLHYWGVLRYAAAESMIALLYYQQSNDNKYYDFAKSQMEYILGKNPLNMSFEIGFGTTWPKNPHHRPAQGWQGYEDNNNLKPAKYMLLGALVGGPDKTDKYIDSVGEYQYSEVAIDYNAGFVGALAGMFKHSGPRPVHTPTPTTNKPTPTTTSTPTPTASNPATSTPDIGYTLYGYVAPDFQYDSSKASMLQQGFKVEIPGTRFSTVTDENGYFKLTMSGMVFFTAPVVDIKISKKNYLYYSIKNIRMHSDGVEVSPKSNPKRMWAGDMEIDGMQDNAINMADVMEIAKGFNTVPGNPKYSVDSDLNRDDAINMSDIMIVAKHFNGVPFEDFMYYLDI